jgi:hypothetical protein
MLFGMALRQPEFRLKAMKKNIKIKGSNTLQIRVEDWSVRGHWVEKPLAFFGVVARLWAIR